MKKYIVKILEGLDIFIASFIWDSKPRETISGYLGINYPGSVFTLALNWVFWKMGWWPDRFHCFDVKNEEEKIFQDEN